MRSERHNKVGIRVVMPVRPRLCQPNILSLGPPRKTWAAYPKQSQGQTDLNFTPQNEFVVWGNKLLRLGPQKELKLQARWGLIDSTTALFSLKPVRERRW